MFEGILKIVKLKEMGISNVIGFDVTNNPGIRMVIAEELNKCLKKYNGRVHITLEPPYKARTTGKGSQSNKLHGIIRQISQETGNSMATIKDRCKELAVQWHDYPCETIEKNGRSYLIPWSEARLNTVQESWLIEAAEYLAAEYAEIILKD